MLPILQLRGSSQEGKKKKGSQNSTAIPAYHKILGSDSVSIDTRSEGFREKKRRERTPQREPSKERKLEVSNHSHQV